ncbi:MAG TPA: CopG family transcriptional regulator [Gaiellaceae bacterium]|jgi:Arc/MetJ-type ribon-helix-helix transcriptional regulator|nr:CopG family transcriptional regulator [Gaiellaceae bacterium]
MKRTTVSLPDELAAAVMRAADRRRVSVSELTREALSAHLGLDRPAGKRTLGFAKLGASGFRDTSNRIEEILAEEWDPARNR